ncbi:MAG: sigma-70 family RNA polymerase sigma factor [Gammaproteobacteria bacterium]|nr:MAG: sigma-70 family RNA polymerase sigma factor [Gammaproteobacteria bacterium]
MLDEQLLNRLYRYCRALCREEADAYDLLQSGLERCLRRPPASKEKLFGYAIRIIRNIHLDNWRHDRIVEFEPLEDASGATDLDVNTLESIVIDSDQLDHVWRKLTDLEREILFLWAVEGYTTGDIASHIGMPRGSILSTIHRMRKRISTGTDSAAAGGLK